MSAEIIHGDCRTALEFMPSASVHSIVTDPPYALVSIQKRFGKPGSAPAQHGRDGLYARASAGFMGKQWDTGETAFDPEFWAEALRVLKPGGHVLAFGGTRTYHRLACAIEDAGFEIRDQIGWLYGSGFPKSHNQHGEWEGWGTALKPAWEPIVMARRPLAGTVESNLIGFGVGAINIDGCRVLDGTETGGKKPIYEANFGNTVFGKGMGGGAHENTNGRWPANIIHDGSAEVLDAFPDSNGSGSARTLRRSAGTRDGDWGVNASRADEASLRDAGTGSAARFFYCAKASRTDRDDGLSGRSLETVSDGRAVAADNAYQRGKTLRANTHPTVKPTELMRYLCRLVTPPGGTVLDPFMGSGSTGRGAVLEGFNFIGVEMEAEYVDIARARIAAVQQVAPFRQEVAPQPFSAMNTGVFA